MGPPLGTQLGIPLVDPLWGPTQWETPWGHFRLTALGNPKEGNSCRPPATSHGDLHWVTPLVN